MSWERIWSCKSNWPCKKLSVWWDSRFSTKFIKNLTYQSKASVCYWCLQISRLAEKLLFHMGLFWASFCSWCALMTSHNKHNPSFSLTCITFLTAILDHCIQLTRTSIHLVWIKDLAIVAYNVPNDKKNLIWLDSRDQKFIWSKLKRRHDATSASRVVSCILKTPPVDR